eukprot:5842282-Amphidinium_carterae.1
MDSTLHGPSILQRQIVQDKATGAGTAQTCREALRDRPNCGRGSVGRHIRHPSFFVLEADAHTPSLAGGTD